jgi:glycine betaine catabolism A
MNLPVHVDLVRLLIEQRTTPRAKRGVGVLPAHCFTSPARFAAERAHLFARTPSVVALVHHVRDPGAVLAVDVAGVSCVLVRGNDGVLRGFLNACRHRGTELVARECNSQVKKTLVCRYHAWTYDLTGRLAHVPHASGFEGCEAGRDLVPVHVAERFGFVFAALQPFDIDAHLAAIAADLDAFGAAQSFVHRESTREVAANWKLIVDAFLDGYHIRVLHKNSVGRFFVDGLVEAERAGPHVRAATARNALLDVDANDLAQHDVRTLATPSYLVFPCTILIVHPDYLSVMRIVPIAPDRTRFCHTMLVPHAPTTDAERARFDDSFALIDEGVFAREDLAVVEAIQRGLATGANEDVLYGDLEHASLWFHQAIDDVLSDRAAT